MGNISNLQSGQSFKVIQKIEKKDVSAANVAITDTNQFLNKTSQAEIGRVKSTFADRYSENGKVELRIEDKSGMTVIQGSKISLDEMLEQGGTLAKFAAELKSFDSNKDNHITEDELYTSWGEHLTQSAVTVGGAAAAGFGTGSTIGAIGGTVAVPGLGTATGWLAGGGLVAAVAGGGAAIWEGVRTVGYAMNDNYDAPAWAR